MNGKLLAGGFGVLMVLALGAAAVEQVTRQEFDGLTKRVSHLEARDKEQQVMIRLLGKDIAALRQGQLDTQGKALAKAAGDKAVPAQQDQVPGKWTKLVTWDGIYSETARVRQFTAQGPWRLRWQTWGNGAITVSVGYPYIGPKWIEKSYDGLPIIVHPFLPMQTVVSAEGTAEGVTEVVQGAGTYEVEVSTLGNQRCNLTVEQQVP